MVAVVLEEVLGEVLALVDVVDVVDVVVDGNENKFHSRRQSWEHHSSKRMSRPLRVESCLQMDYDTLRSNNHNNNSNHNINVKCKDHCHNQHKQPSRTQEK